MSPSRRRSSNVRSFVLAIALVLAGCSIDQPRRDDYYSRVCTCGHKRGEHGRPVCNPPREQCDCDGFVEDRSGE